MDADTTTAVAEGRTIDTVENGSEIGDLVLNLIATSVYEGTIPFGPHHTGLRRP